MTKEVYEKVVNNIKEFIAQEIDRRDDSYLTDNQDRVIEKFIEEICNEEEPRMKSCTEKETEAYRKLMGLDNNGERQTYKQVCQELHKHNIRPLIFNANRKLMCTIYKEILFEDKVKIIQMEYKYQDNKGMIIPEDIEIANFKSIIYFEYEKLREIGIKNVDDIISYTIPEIIEIINNISKNSKRQTNKEQVAKELIQAIHILGFLFNGENGYEEQLEYFDRVKKIMRDEISKTSYEDSIIKQELCNRNELIFYYNILKREKELPFRSIEAIEKEIFQIKEEIIKKEKMIRIRKI